MVKKKSNGQTAIIAILCVLLLISIGFGVTYSYYNGKTNLVKGHITTANLSISLHGEQFGQTTEFSISAPINEAFLVPGNGLNNLKLNLYNQCNQETYMVVVYSLGAIKTVIYKDPVTGEKKEKKEDITSQLTNTPAIAFQDEAFSTEKWKSITYTCTNVQNTAYTCLVGLNTFESREANSEGYYINVLQENKIKIPEQWTNILQNCDVTISIMAYAVQADLPLSYMEPILQAESDGDMEAKAQAIAKATLEICGVDKAKASNN